MMASCGSRRDDVVEAPSERPDTGESKPARMSRSEPQEW